MPNIKSIIDLDDKCVIKWRLTDVCNYACTYCIRKPLVHDGHTLTKDMNACIDAIDDVKRIARELYEINNRLVKIDLIGGEISLFDQLNAMIGILFIEPCIAEINITTNLSRNADYYIQLCETAKKYNKVLSLTASFHFQYAKLDEFMDKAKIMHNYLEDNFKCETVITDGNEYIDQFISKCNDIGCYYMCEEDMKDKTKKGLTVKNYKSGNRYKVIMDNDEEILYTTRNEVCKRYGHDGFAIDTTGMKCTRDNNYIYIEQNMVIPCHTKVYIRNYRVSPYPKYCSFGKCSLCGHMSIFK